MVIKHILKKKGMKNYELAERLGILPQTVSQRLKNPTETTIKKIAEALDVEPWELFISEWELRNRYKSMVTEDLHTVTCPHCGKRLAIRGWLVADETTDDDTDQEQGE